MDTLSKIQLYAIPIQNKKIVSPTPVNNSPLRNDRSNQKHSITTPSNQNQPLTKKKQSPLFLFRFFFNHNNRNKKRVMQPRRSAPLPPGTAHRRAPPPPRSSSSPSGMGVGMVTEEEEEQKTEAMAQVRECEGVFFGCWILFLILFLFIGLYSSYGRSKIYSIGKKALSILV